MLNIVVKISMECTEIPCKCLFWHKNRLFNSSVATRAEWANAEWFCEVLSSLGVSGLCVGPCRASGEVGVGVALGKLRLGRALQNLEETRSSTCTRDTELEAKARLENCGISSSLLKGAWPKERGVSYTGFQVKDGYLQKLTKLGNGPTCWRYSWEKMYLLIRSWVKCVEGRMCQQSGSYQYYAAIGAAMRFRFCFCTKIEGGPEFMMLYIQLTWLPAIFMIEIISSGLLPAHTKHIYQPSGKSPPNISTQLSWGQMKIHKHSRRRVSSDHLSPFFPDNSELKIGELWRKGSIFWLMFLLRVHLVGATLYLWGEASVYVNECVWVWRCECEGVCVCVQVCVSGMKPPGIHPGCSTPVL